MGHGASVYIGAHCCFPSNNRKQQLRTAVKQTKFEKMEKKLNKWNWWKV